MKVLFFIGSLQSGGAERVAVRLSDGFADTLGWDTTLVTGDAIATDFYITEHAKRHSLGFDYSNSRSLREQLHRVRQVRRYIQAEKPDLVVFSSIDFALRGLFSTLGMRVPKIVCEHNNYFAVKSPRKRRIRNRLYPFADRIFLLTQRDIPNYPPQIQAKCRVVSNPLGVDGHYSKHTFNGRLLAIGRLTEQKAFHRMLHVMALLPDTFTLDIVGEGPLDAALKSTSEAMGLTHRVTFAGRTSDVSRYYEHASLLLMTSLFEGLPMVIAEANAHAVPVVSYDCETGPREMIRDGETGFVIADDDADDMAAAIQGLANDPERYQRMRDAAYAAAEQYSLANTLTNWQSAVAELCDDNG